MLQLARDGATGPGLRQRRHVLAEAAQTLLQVLPPAAGPGKRLPRRAPVPGASEGPGRTLEPGRRAPSSGAEKRGSPEPGLAWCQLGKLRRCRSLPGVDSSLGLRGDEPRGRRREPRLLCGAPGRATVPAATACVRAAFVGIW